MFHYGKDVLTAGKALAIARGKLSATIAPDTRKKVAASQHIVEHVVEQGAAVYGITPE